MAIVCIMIHNTMNIERLDGKLHVTWDVLMSP